MRIECYGGEGYAANCYLLTDDAQSAALLIDPSVAPHDICERRGSALPPLSAVVLTHAHFDHMLALQEYRRMGIPLALHEADAPALSDPQKNLFGYFLGEERRFDPPEILLREGDLLSLGEERVRILYTPGHALGAICLASDGILISGDTLFAGDIGRTDLYGGHAATLRTSLSRLRALEGEWQIYPGHGPSTTLSREKKYNPYMMTE